MRHHSIRTRIIKLEQVATLAVCLIANRHHKRAVGSGHMAVLTIETHRPFRAFEFWPQVQSVVELYGAGIGIAGAVVTQAQPLFRSFGPDRDGEFGMVCRKVGDPFSKW